MLLSTLTLVSVSCFNGYFKIAKRRFVARQSYRCNSVFD